MKSENNFDILVYDKVGWLLVNGNVLIKYLDYKTETLIDYSKVFIQMLINEHKIVVENRKVYAKIVNEFIDLYVHNYYFDQEDSSTVMEKMVPDLADSRVKNSLIIASICVECDKILGSLDEEYTKKEIRKVVEKLVALFEIDLNKVRNKNAFENLALAIQENYKKEKRFMSSLNSSDEEEFYNLYRYNLAMKDVYFVEYNLDLPEFKKWYPANVKKALNDTDISSAMALISLQNLSIVMLKELIEKKKCDRFIVRIDTGLLRSNKKYGDLIKMLDNLYLKKSLYLLINYEDYQNYNSKVLDLKKHGYRCMIEIKNNDLSNIAISNNETIFLDKYIIEKNQEKVNELINQGVSVVEKNNMFTFTEREILEKNKEEVQ